MQRLSGARYFSSLQVILKKNTASALEAFDVKSVTTPPVQKDNASAKVKFLGSFVSEGDILTMRNSVQQVGKPVGENGLLEVLEGGSKFKKGDKVHSSGFTGVWQSEFVIPESSLKQAPANVTVSNFADYIAHAHALAMLKGLKTGDVVAVSKAESPLGFGVARIGKKKGLRVIAVVGGTIDTPEVMKKLKQAGAEIVTIEDYNDGTNYVVSNAFRRLLSDIPKSKVVVNGQGGLYAHELARTLGDGGLMYVFGGSPFTLPSSLFIERGIIVRGPLAPSNEDYEEAGKLLQDLGDIKTPSVEFSLKEIGKAVDGVGLGPVSILKA